MWELVLEWDDVRRRWRPGAIAMIAAKADGTQKRIRRERRMMARRSETVSPTRHDRPRQRTDPTTIAAFQSPRNAHRGGPPRAPKRPRSGPSPTKNGSPRTAVFMGRDAEIRL
jgi:hypothetical protein